MVMGVFAENYEKLKDLSVSGEVLVLKMKLVKGGLSNLAFRLHLERRGGVDRRVLNSSFPEFEQLFFDYFFLFCEFDGEFSVDFVSPELKALTKSVNSLYNFNFRIDATKVTYEDPFCVTTTS